MLIRSLLGIVVSFLILILGLIWIMNFEFNYYIYGIIAIGLILLISSIVTFCGILKEKKDDLITEELSNISIVYAGYHNHDRMLKGVVSGENRFFMLRGKDKKIAERIKESNPNYIVIVYHSSNHRIESISIPS